LTRNQKKTLVVFGRLLLKGKRIIETSGLVD
jgi:hypothetical protein